MRIVLLVGLLAVVTGCGERVGGSAPAGPEPEPPWGTAYVLDRASVAGRPHELVAGTAVTVEFTDDRRLVANAGCNTMSGPAELADGRLVVRDLATTEMGCDQARHAQDDWLHAVLGGGPRWERDGARLVLTSGETELALTDRAAAEPDRPLAGPTWTVDTLVEGTGPDGTAASTTAAATLVFGADRVEVSTGCNDGSAAYTATGDTIRFSALVLTRRGCPPDIMRTEAAVVAVLRDEVGYAVTADTLELDHPSGRGLRLRAG